LKTSESIGAISAALVDFQADVLNPPRTAENPFFKNRYTPLGDLLKLMRPILSKHDLAVIQTAGGDGATISIYTTIIHKSGEFIEACPLILALDKPTPQGAGSAITYGRRYALSAMLGIASEDDDDAQAAEPNGKKAAKKPAKKLSANPTDTRAKLLTKLWIVAKKTFGDYDDDEVKRILHTYIEDEFGLQSSKDLDIQQMEIVLDWLEDWGQPDVTPQRQEDEPPVSHSTSSPAAPKKGVKA